MNKQALRAALSDLAEYGLVYLDNLDDVADVVSNVEIEGICIAVGPVAGDRYRVEVKPVENRRNPAGDGLRMHGR